MRIIILLIPLAVLLSCSNSRVEELEAEVKAYKAEIESYKDSAAAARKAAMRVMVKADSVANIAFQEALRADSIRHSATLKIDSLIEAHN